MTKHFFLIDFGFYKETTMTRLTDEDIALWQSVMTNTVSFTYVIQASVKRTKLTPVVKPSPRTTIDLHGMTIQDAHREVISQIDNWKGRTKSICFITGKSGDIRREFTHWVAALLCVRRVEMINGGGCFRVYYKKNKSP